MVAAWWMFDQASKATRRQIEEERRQQERRYTMAHLVPGSGIHIEEQYLQYGPGVSGGFFGSRVTEPRDLPIKEHIRQAIVANLMDGDDSGRIIMDARHLADQCTDILLHVLLDRLQMDDVFEEYYGVDDDEEQDYWPEEGY